MLVSGRGARWNQVRIAMCRFTAHIDDSGTDPKQKVAIATALVIPANRIVALEREWEALKKKEDFKCFHTSEFCARNLDSEFADWDDKKHTRVFRRVREIAKKYGVVTVSFAIFKKDYDEVVPPDLRPRTGRFHYSWAIRNMLDWLYQWRKKSKVKYPLEYIFDNIKRGDPRRIEIEDILEQAEEVISKKGEPGEYINSSFRLRCDLPGLQLADLLAWTSYRYALFVFCKEPLSSKAETAWKDFNSHRGGDWRIALGVKREHLEKWVAAVKASGQVDVWFGEWEAWKAAENERKRQQHKQRVPKVRQHHAGANQGSA